MDQSEHKKLGIELFNATWDLIDKSDRTETENFEMIHKAHASCYHWSMGGGTSLNEARGEWQVSRVYALLKMGEGALVHGKRSLDICLADGYADFDLAFGYEAVARAYAVLQDEENMKCYVQSALNACKDIKEEGDRKYALQEINGISL